MSITIPFNQSCCIDKSPKGELIDVQDLESGDAASEHEPKAQVQKPSANESHNRFGSRNEKSMVEEAISRLDEIKNFNLCQEINSMHEVEKQQEKVAIIKARLPFGRLVFLGTLAGWWVGLAVMLVVSIAGGVPVSTRSSWPMLPKVIAGFFFPVAIFFIVLFGGELFTGNSMSMLIGFMARRVTIRDILYNWSIVLVTNFAGATATVYSFGYLTGLFESEPWLSYIQGVAVSKINLKPEVAFLRAIPANALVCACVLLGLSARDMTGKMMAMFFPIMTFAIIGYEHAIANMGFIPLGLMYGAQVDYRKWLYQNLLLSILGNIIGGGVIIGGASYFLFDWTQLVAKVQSVADDEKPAVEQAKGGLLFIADPVKQC